MQRTKLIHAVRFTFVYLRLDRMPWPRKRHVTRIFLTVKLGCCGRDLSPTALFSGPTCVFCAVHMSPFGTWRTSQSRGRMSAFGSKADMASAGFITG